MTQSANGIHPGPVTQTTYAPLLVVYTGVPAGILRFSGVVSVDLVINRDPFKMVCDNGFVFWMGSVPDVGLNTDETKRLTDDRSMVALNNETGLGEFAMSIVCFVRAL